MGEGGREEHVDSPRATDKSMINILRKRPTIGAIGIFSFLLVEDRIELVFGSLREGGRGGGGGLLLKLFRGPRREVESDVVN